MSGAVGLLLSSAVRWPLAVVALVAFVVLAFGVPLWALRRHNRMFPKGWDRTGWRPEPGKARRLETMWTYFSGRGGPE